MAPGALKRTVGLRGLADGRRVAVKIQHLDIENMAQLDLETMRRVLGIVGFFLRPNCFRHDNSAGQRGGYCH